MTLEVRKKFRVDIYFIQETNLEKITDMTRSPQRAGVKRSDCRRGLPATLLSILRPSRKVLQRGRKIRQPNTVTCGVSEM